MDEYRGKRVTVMGLGSFGGGIGAVRFLAQRQAHVTVTDLRSPDELRESMLRLDDVPIAQCHLGGHRREDFVNTDLIVVNPAVPRENPFLETARDAGVPLTTEINLFFQYCKAPIIGVTGSNGKSTTTALIHALLEPVWRGTSAGPNERKAAVWLGGNIGRSLLPNVEKIGTDDIVVLELSSFQLEDLAALKTSPAVAVVTNFTPNHLDRHGTMEAYRQAKQNILRFQKETDLAVLNGDDLDVAGWAACTPARIVTYGATGSQSEVLDALLATLRLPGRHNRLNALAAIATVRALTGVEPGALRETLAGFHGLPHRLELVAEIDGRKFYNDSISTTPESTVAALEAFDGPVILIAGGYDKGIDLSTVARSVAIGAKAVALIGQTAAALAEKLTACSKQKELVTCARHTDLEAAVDWAWEQSAAGDVILLSPACASYDQFRNFQHRGEVFSQRVGQIAPPK